MGTHISRVKSVDLDSWTDEQMQSILSWGNARANKYWEAKLAQGHAPSESKIENFIRTKYELKRWVMDGPKPDPSTLDVDGDDDVPLSLVKEKQAIERKESLRKANLSGPSQTTKTIPAPQGDLIGGPDPIPSRSGSAGPPAAKVAPKAEPAPPRATSTKDSLLGLDFFGEPQAPPRPASTTGVSSPGGQSRPDLKQSILSLYATAPRSQAQPQQHAQNTGSFGGMASPTFSHHSQGSVGGGFQDAFSSLSISNNAAPKPAAPDPFANLGSATNRTTQSSTSNAFGGLSGGSFFDSKPVQTPIASQQQQPQSAGFGDFGAFSSPSPSSVTAPKSSAMGDLFDLSSPVTQTTSPPPNNPIASGTSNSVFNLSAPQAKPVTTSPAPTTTTTGSFGGAGFAGADVWGSSEWSSPSATTAAPATAAAPAQKNPESAKTTDFGWGNTGGSFASTPIVPGTSGGFNPAPKVAADEEFGGWASSTGPSNGGAGAAKTGSGFGDEDLFSNVWQ